MLSREEMLKEMDEWRAKGRTVGIDGHVGDWFCEIDGKRFQGSTPMEAFAKACEAIKPKGAGDATLD